MQHQEDRPSVYEAEYSFDDIKLTGQSVVKIVCALWGLGYREKPTEPYTWSYSGDLTAVYAEGRDAQGNKAHRFIYDFNSQEEVDTFLDLMEVDTCIAIASAYEPDSYDDAVTIEMLQTKDDLELALTHFRPSRNWSKGHWNNLLVRQNNKSVSVRVVGIEQLREQQFEDNPYMRGDFHSKKVQNLFASL